MITITNKNDIEAAYEKATNHKGGYPTCRIIDHEAAGCQEWAEHCTIDGVPACIYWVFEDEECDVDDGSFIPFDADHVSKVILAERDDDGDYESLKTRPQSARPR